MTSSLGKCCQDEVQTHSTVRVKPQGVMHEQHRVNVMVARPTHRLEVWDGIWQRSVGENIYAAPIIVGQGVHKMPPSGAVHDGVYK